MNKIPSNMKPKIKKPKLDMNMSFLMLGVIILVLGNIYYTYRQFNEINSRLNNLSKRNITNVENTLPEQNTKEQNDNCSMNPLKKIFINKTNNKVSENITKDIQIVENNDENNDEVLNEESNLDNMDINFKELDKELEISNIDNDMDVNSKVNTLNDKSKKDLIDIAEDNNISKSGTKTELINRILESGIEIE